MNKKQFIKRLCLGAMLSIATFTVFAQERVVKGQVVDNGCHSCGGRFD